MKIANKKNAFTLIEVMVACVVLAVFMTGVYQLFIGGSKTAGKAQWINGTVEEQRNALAYLSREIKDSTYPTTIFSDSFFDPCDNKNKSVAQKYYMKIKKDGEKIEAPNSGSVMVMKWVVCQPERPPNSPGNIRKNELYLDFKQVANEIPLANLRIKTENFSFTTDASSEHARSGKLNTKKLKTGNVDKVLVHDVQFIEFSVAGTLPPEKSVDFFPISVKIHTLYPKDKKVFKETSIMATPQVAIETL